MTDRLKKIADVLYDELTGRHDCDPWEPNAVLKPVLPYTGPNPTERDRELHRLLLDAQYLGYEVHRNPGDRWNLALRLAQKVIDAEDSLDRQLPLGEIDD